MAIGRITGPMLFSNLERQGVDLQVDTDLVYFDVARRRLGINNVNPQQSLDVPGNVKLANLTILGDTITSNSGKIQLGSVSNVKITGGAENYILYTDGNGNLNFGNLNTLSLGEGFTGNTIQIGTNSIGSLSNALVIPTTTTVTDGIALLNRLLGNITDSTGSTIHVNGNITAGGNLTANYGTLAGNLTVLGSITSAGNIVSTLTGNVNADYILSNTTSNIHLLPGAGTGIVYIDSTAALVIPAGNNAERPVTSAGAIRFNTFFGTLEYFDGTDWVQVNNQFASQLITTADGVTQTFTLDQASSAAAILVSINGVVQSTGGASPPYTVAGNQITFAQPPAATDLIDIRFIAGLSVPDLTGFTGQIGPAGAPVTFGGDLTYGAVPINNMSKSVTSVGQTATLIDTWPVTSYRSAKYILSITDSVNSEYETSEIVLVQNGTTAKINTYGIVYSNTSVRMSYTANISAGNVNLYATGTSTSNTIKFVRTAIPT